MPWLDYVIRDTHVINKLFLPAFILGGNKHYDLQLSSMEQAFEHSLPSSLHRVSHDKMIKSLLLVSSASRSLGVSGLARVGALMLQSHDIVE